MMHSRRRLKRCSSYGTSVLLRQVLSGRRLFDLLVKRGTIVTSVLLAVKNRHSLFYGAAGTTDPFSFRTR